MSMPNYAVIVTFSFYDQISVLLFETQEDALNFIKNDVLKKYHIDIDETGCDSEYTIFEDEGRAVLTTHWRDTDDVTEWRIGTVYDHREG